jgi:hypothetical protein
MVDGVQKGTGVARRVWSSDTLVAFFNRVGKGELKALFLARFIGTADKSVRPPY